MSQNPSDGAIGNPLTYLLAEILGHNLGSFSDSRVTLLIEDEETGRRSPISIEKLHDKLNGDEDFKEQFDRLCGGLNQIELVLKMSDLDKHDLDTIEEIEVEPTTDNEDEKNEQ